jgi:DNA polymerase epsilon subunit 4
VNLVSSDAVFAITKATELFIESLAKECYVHTSQAKKKTIQRKDLDAAISTVDQLIFLEGAIV